MKAALVAMLTRSPWAPLWAAVVLLIALWLVLSRSYSLRVQGRDMQLELAPTQPQPPASAVVREVPNSGG